VPVRHPSCQEPAYFVEDVPSSEERLGRHSLYGGLHI